MSRCVSKDGIPCVICAPMILARSQGPALIEVPFPPDCAFEPHADSSESMALYSRQLEESWCGDEVEGSAIEFRKQAHERRGHPLRGHHFVPVEDQNGIIDKLEEIHKDVT